jgi:hypothetical protein
MSVSIQLEVDGAHLDEPSAVADAFAKHFQSVCNNHCPMDFPSLSQSSEFLSIAPISDFEVCKAIKRLKPSKSVGLDDISRFVIKGCSAIFIPILRHIFNLCLTQQNFPTVWKETAIVPVFKRGNMPLRPTVDPFPFSIISLSYLNLLFAIMFCIMLN